MGRFVLQSYVLDAKMNVISLVNEFVEYITVYVTTGY